MGPRGQARAEVSLRGASCPGLGVGSGEGLSGSQVLAEAGAHLDRPVGKAGTSGLRAGAARCVRHTTKESELELEPCKARAALWLSRRAASCFADDVKANAMATC